MNASPLSPLHIPLIVQAIAESVSFVDMLNYIRVNWAWRDAVIPVL